MSEYFLTYGNPVPDGCIAVNLSETTLDEAIDDGEVMTIIAVDILHRFSRSEHAGVIAKVCRKLRKGGELRIAFFDIDQVMKKGIIRALELEELDKVFFGHGNFKSIADYQSVLSHLSAAGMSCVRMIQDSDLRFHIVAKKG